MTSFFTGLLQAQQAPPPGGGFAQFIPILLMVGVLYFLLIRPQAKKAKLHQHMLGQLKKGDDVVTTGGLIGRITGIRDDEITLQVQEGVRLRILRSAVSGMQKPSSEPAKADAKASAT